MANLVTQVVPGSRAFRIEDRPVVEIIAELQKFLEMVPEEHRSEAVLEYDYSPDFGLDVSISYGREETPEETEKREAMHRAARLQEVERLESNLKAARRAAGLE